MSDIAERVRRVIAYVFSTETEQLLPHDETHFVADLHADSLDRVEVVMGLEEEFGIDLPDEDGESMQTVGDAIRIVTAALAADALAEGREP